MADASVAKREAKSSVVAHYEQSLSKHGPTARGMDWKDEASQALRFDVLCGIGDLRAKTVHEIAAGVGHLHDYLQSKNIGAIYSGSDLSREMVAEARRLHPGVAFDVRDATEVEASGPYDLVFCSGLFNVKLDTPEPLWRELVESTLRSMFRASRIGIAFNLMSDHVDYQSDVLFYSNPAAMLKFCLDEFGQHVVLRHDYPLHEYTVYVYRETAS